MRVAAIDLGTNTFILLVADTLRGGLHTVHDEVRIVRLGQGVHENRRFHPEALARAEEAFAGFAKTIRSLGVDRVLATATSAARDVENGDELIQLGRRYDIPVQIISGDEEAEFTFSGTVPGTLNGPAMIIDVGGGSTELIFGDQTGLTARKSIDIGAVRLTEAFVSQHPISPIEMNKMTIHVQRLLSLAKLELPQAPGPRAIAVAGTPTTLATLDMGLPFESERVQGYVLGLQRLSYWVQRLAEMKVEERQQLAGMEPKRADVIVAGALILMLSAQTFGVQELEVSVRGLRYGVARSLAAR